MTEQIGKVTLDYTFYNGQDQYSDGDIEKDLLQLIMEEPDVEKILAEDDRWPVLYHFSPVRQNILEWYPLKKDASVLEIGAGCGAISGVLCRNAKHVTSVDLSKRRSLINANRNKEYDNLTIMVGNFNDVVLKEKYDYIKKAPLLLLDDIGAEYLTPWARDEILGTILQYRMDEELPTFFTSNMNLKQLEEHFSITSVGKEEIKARRMIERIKSLTNDFELIGESNRK